MLRPDAEETSLRELETAVVSREAKVVLIASGLRVLKLSTSLDVVAPLVDSRVVLNSIVPGLPALPLKLMLLVAARGDAKVTDVVSEAADESKLISLVDDPPLSGEIDDVVDDCSETGTAMITKPIACVPEGWIVERVTVD